MNMDLHCAPVIPSDSWRCSSGINRVERSLALGEVDIAGKESKRDQSGVTSVDLCKVVTALSEYHEGSVVGGVLLVHVKLPRKSSLLLLCTLPK